MPTVLDCTLRDGGYYTGWQFDDALVDAYLAACVAVGVDVVELGYTRVRPVPGGAYGSVPDELRRSLRDLVPAAGGPRFAVMVDAADALPHPPREVAGLLRERLAPSSLPVDLIRVAVPYRRTAETVDLVRALRGAGYGVCLNLMQIDLATPEELRDCLAAVGRAGDLEALYVADSLGSLHPRRATELVRRVVGTTGLPVGFHAHENQGLALHNTLTVLEAGASWVDATMSGMGRGAGNARTEQLLPLLRPDVPVEPLFDFVARHMIPLQQKHGWGSNVYYALAGLREVHPTYVQQLEQDGSTDAGTRMRVLGQLADQGATAYSADRLERELRHA